MSYHHSRRQLSVLTHLALPVEAVMPCWHLHRQLAPLTHLDLGVEDHCRLPRCASVSPCCTAGLLLTLIPRLVW